MLMHGNSVFFALFVLFRVSKAVLLQLVSLVPGSSERDAVRRGVSLCRALGGELDLSHTTLDQSTCAALALMLDFSDGLTELDLSHCQLTDQLLLTLITHLHKVQVLEWVSDCTDTCVHVGSSLVGGGGSNSLKHIVYYNRQVELVWDSKQTLSLMSWEDRRTAFLRTNVPS